MFTYYIMLKVALSLLLCNLWSVMQFKVKFNPQMEHIYENVQPKVIILGFRRMHGSQTFPTGYNMKFYGKKHLTLMVSWWPACLKEIRLEIYTNTTYLGITLFVTIIYKCLVSHSLPSYHQVTLILLQQRDGPRSDTY